MIRHLYYFVEGGAWGQVEAGTLDAALDLAAADHATGERYPKRIEAEENGRREIVATRIEILARAQELGLLEN